MILEGTWEVTSLAVDDEQVESIPGSIMTLEFSEGRVGGNASINRFMGQLGEDRLFGPLATTMMAGPSELMEQERRYLELLGRTDSMLFRPGKLDLIADNDVLVTLKWVGTKAEPKTVK